jgi:hypothetical protein
MQQPLIFGLIILCMQTLILWQTHNTYHEVAPKHNLPLDLYCTRSHYVSHNELLPIVFLCEAPPTTFSCADMYSLNSLPILGALSTGYLLKYSSILLSALLYLAPHLMSFSCFRHTKGSKGSIFPTRLAMNHLR